MIPLLATPARRIGTVLAASVLLLSVGLSGGFAIGREWERGRTAIADRATMQVQIADLHDAAEELRQRGIDTAQDFRTSARRMDVLLSDYTVQIDAIDEQFSTEHAALSRYLDALDGVDLLCIDAAGVQQLNAAAARIADGAAGATGGAADDAEATVPGGAADVGGRPAIDGDAGVAGRSEAVRPMREPAGGAERGGDGL